VARLELLLQDVRFAARTLRREPVLSGATIVVLALALALAASFVVNRVLQSQLVGVSPYDLLTLTLASWILISVASAWLPVAAAASGSVVGESSADWADSATPNA
jgi:hypothetical protein